LITQKNWLTTIELTSKKLLGICWLQFLSFKSLLLQTAVFKISKSLLKKFSFLTNCSLYSQQCSSKTSQDRYLRKRLMNCSGLNRITKSTPAKSVWAIRRSYKTIICLGWWVAILQWLWSLHLYWLTLSEHLTYQDSIKCFAKIKSIRLAMKKYWEPSMYLYNSFKAVTQSAWSCFISLPCSLKVWLPTT
jgi:hypothetical protein